MKGFTKLFAAGTIFAASLALAGCGNGASDVEGQVVLRLGHASSQDSTWNRGLERFSELVYEKTDGEVKVEVFPNELLGSEVDNVNSIMTGDADMVLSGESLQAWAPIVGMMSTPFLIEDSEHMRAVVEGEIGEMFEREISEGAGLKVLTYFERGPRLLTSNSPVYDLSDIANMRIRIPNVPLFVSTWQAWGASPTTMAFSEVFTSLQQNVIEAQENPLAMIHSGAFQEVQSYLNNTAHVRSWIYVLIGNQQWDSLTPSQQTALQEAANMAQAYEHQLFLEEEEYLFTLLTEEYGMTFIETDRQQFIDAIEEFYKSGGLSEEQLEVFLSIRELAR